MLIKKREKNGFWKRWDFRISHNEGRIEDLKCKSLYLENP